MPTTSLNTMLETAKKVMQHSYSPYSQYRVGACLKCEDDQLFSGTNVENAAYGLAICGEASAISAMASAGYRKIQEIVIIGSGAELCTPCGACRQRINEFASPDTLVHLANADGIQKTLKVSELLPYAFGPDYLK